MARSLRTPANWPMALLALTIPLTLYASAWPEVTQRAVTFLLMEIGLFYATLLWATTERRLRLGALLLVVAGMATALVAPFGVDWIKSAKGFLNFDPIYAAIPRLIDDPIHPNILAGVLAAGLPLALALVLGRRTKDERRMFVIGPSSFVLRLSSFVVMLVVLILTKSRGAWLGAAAGLTIVSVYHWPRLRRPALAALALVALAGLLMGPAQVAQSLASLAAAPVLGGWNGRLELWSRAIDAIADYPLTGIGMGTFDRVIPLRYPYVVLAGAELAIPHAHNLFLQVAVDLGLPGLIAFVALLGIVLTSALRAARNWAAERDLALQAVGLAAGLVAVLVHGLLDAATWGSKPAIFIWGIMGLIMAHRAVNLQRAADGGRGSSPSVVRRRALA